MFTPSGKMTLLLIGADAALAYLLCRYAEQSGCQLLIQDMAPALEELDHWRPSAIIFASPDGLQSNQPLVEALSTRETPVLVCASASDEARAKKLGADDCLLHPLTYGQFCAVLTHCSQTV